MFNFKKNNNGFTLIELMTVMAIFAVVTATVMANYHGFGRNTAHKNLAYNIALAIREAQVSGITGRNLDTAGGDYFSNYGIYFSLASPKDYIFFRDKTSLGTQHIFDAGQGELIGDYKILSAHSITGLCVYASPGGSCISVPQLNITFKRPQPDAYIVNDDPNTLYPEASIEVSSPEGKKLYIVVSATGQISVQKNP